MVRVSSDRTGGRILSAVMFIPIAIVTFPFVVGLILADNAYEGIVRAIRSRRMGKY